MTMTPEQVAAGLSEAQKAAMMKFPERDYFGAYEVYAEPDVLRSLIALGLSGDGWPDRMTNLGERVRAILEQQK